MIVPAVQDDIRVPAGDEALHGGLYVVGWQVQRSRQMVFPVVRLREHFEQVEGIAAIDLVAQLFA
jgi:hypothetical protein